VSQPVPIPDAATLDRVLVGFLHEEVSKAGFERGVVAVSGGLDSAVSLALAARALGKDNVVAVLLPHRVSSPESSRDGLAVVESVGTAHELYDITPLIEGFTGL
jgi:NAD+ synthase